jgi:serine/threonine protein kinase
MGGEVKRAGPVVDGTASPMDSVTAVGAFALTAAPDRLQAGDLLAGRYQIEAAIGVGASGRVLRAFDRESRAVVAIKILKPELANDSTWVDRLSRELRVGRQIQHPNLCRVFEVGAADGLRFLTMEIALGGTVAQEIRQRHSQRSVPSAPFCGRVADARAIIEGVAALHAAGIIHRDIKPENILRMADGRLVVSDFGLATDPGVGPTSSILVGTPSYMAPEVAIGECGSARADIFSLGIVLHEFLFGWRPTWKAGGSGERVAVVASSPYRPEAALAALCGQCLSAAPERRPPSAGALLTMFDAAVAGRRTLATRRKAAALGWGAAIVLCLGVLVVSRNRWWSRASASFFHRPAVKSGAVLTPAGTAVDWTKGASALASFGGRISCYSLIDQQRTIRVIWGNPSRAEELDLDTGRRKPARLLPETFAEGCPELSPDGRKVLFVRSEDVGTYVFMGAGPDGRSARKIVKGSRPKWLPSGEEFVFDLDSRHPAVFSLPTGELTVLGEGLTGTRQLAEKAVDPSGRYLALRYFDDANNNRIVIEAQGTFESQATFVVPSSALRLGFVGRGPKLTFTLYGSDGSAELIEADWRHGSIWRMGKVPGADIVGVLDTPRGAVVLSRQIRLDAWLDASDRPVQLTHDGTSDGGAMSRRGDLLIQRFLDDRRYVIALRGAEGRDRLLTTGPLDLSPSFFADSDRWVYSNYQTQQIFQCRLSTSTCASLYREPSTAAWPTVDPFGERIAYVTLLNAPRLRVLSLATSVARDLGPVLNECPPVWVPGGHLWALQSTEPQTTWAEFDVTAGLRTGETVSQAPAPDRRCQLPPRLRADARRASPRVFAVADEHSELLTRPPL